MFVDLTPRMLIMMPLLFPRAAAVGIDPVYFESVLIITLMTGGITLPVGILALIPSAITKAPMAGIFRDLMSFAAAMFVAILAFVRVSATPPPAARW